jgi:hypothetical protein
MANLAHDYGILPVRTKKANGQATTIGLKLLDFMALRAAYPGTKARIAAVLAASLEFDRLHPDAPRNRKLSRSSFIRNKLLPLAA